MSVDKKYTEKMRGSFQEKLRKRVEAMDPAGLLGQWLPGIGYYYATGLNFGKLFKTPNSSLLIAEFQEVMDNIGGGDWVDQVGLVFSRPSDVIYIMVSSNHVNLAELRPVLLLETKKLGPVSILRLEDLLEVL
jgi:hypothetical protein